MLEIIGASQEAREPQDSAAQEPERTCWRKNLTPEEWLKQHSEADAVSAEWGEPIPCEFCGTLTKITYFACTYGLEDGDVHPIFEEACFGCARVKLGIRKLPPTSVVHRTA